MQKRFFSRLPEPLNKQGFHLFKKGISDNDSIEVWINEHHDFACLDPKPVVDYENYQPRAKKFNLEKYKNNRAYYLERLQKIDDFVRSSTSLLEVGASDGLFLECFRELHPEHVVYAIEPDESTLDDRNRRGLTSFSDFNNFKKEGVKVDVACMFHVFEHIDQPKAMLSDIESILKPSGKLIIEVPALSDPLISLYQSDAFIDFYFQQQHPYVYTAASLSNVLECHGFTVSDVVYFQRYGLENHLSWLKNGRPGGDRSLRDVVGEIEHIYRGALEQASSTDSIILIAKAKAAI